MSITHQLGTRELTINQQLTPPIDGLFKDLGTFAFQSKQEYVITISNRETDGYVVVDAIQVVPLESSPE